VPRCEAKAECHVAVPPSGSDPVEVLLLLLYGVVCVKRRVTGDERFGCFAVCMAANLRAGRSGRQDVVAAQPLRSFASVYEHENELTYILPLL
jgi:hypothetical protein